MQEYYWKLAQIASEKTTLEVYDLEFWPKKNLLRVYIQDPQSETASLEDCIAFDHLLGPLIEESEETPEDLTLEVSSPGVFRPLRTKGHYQSVLGKRIKVKAKKETFVGVLNSVDENFKWIKVFVERKGPEVQIRPEDIKKAHLNPSFKEDGP